MEIGKILKEKKIAEARVKKGSVENIIDILKQSFEDYEGQTSGRITKKMIKAGVEENGEGLTPAQKKEIFDSLVNMFYRE
jgi:hypothetical protein